MSQEMMGALAASGVQRNEAPIKSPGFIEVVQRYRAPLRCEKNKHRATLDKGDASDAECLQKEVYASNATMSPEGRCTMLVVFEAITGQPGRTRNLRSLKDNKPFNSSRMP